MYDQFETPEPDEAVKLALRRIEEATARGEGSDVDGLAFNEVVVNMGPQHPSTHGVLRLVVTLDGELVKDVIPVIGYLHRCKEKLAEKRTYFQYIPIVDRTEYLASINCEWAYVMTVEKLAGMQVTRRAEFIRVITGELMRIASHLVAVGTFTADLSPLGTAMVFYMFRDREVILDLMEELTGARMMFNYYRFGGVRYDLPDGWVEKCRDFLKMFPQADQGVRGARRRPTPSSCSARRARASSPSRTSSTTASPAPTRAPPASTSTCAARGRTRCTRSSTSRSSPRSTATSSTATAAAWTRCARASRSSSSAWTCCPTGPVQLGSLRAPYVITPPPGSAYVGQENPRGEYGTYIESDGSRYPYRLKFRDPCFCNLQLFPKLLSGNKIADAVAISGSIDLVLGGIDR